MNIVNQLTAEWTRSGLHAGDTVMLHSDVRRTIKRYARTGQRVRPSDLHQSFRNAVGPDGTLLYPTFNYDFTSGVPFDMRETPSQMGVLSEHARTRPDALRTQHPIYSFAVVGAQSDRFAALSNVSAWSPDSPFALLREVGGKVALLDCLNATMIHHAEEMATVDYRVHTIFKGDYTNANGRTFSRCYSFFARNLEMGVRNHLDPIKQAMWEEEGLFKGDRPGEGTGMGVADGQALFDFCTGVLNDGRALGMFYLLGEPDENPVAGT